MCESEGVGEGDSASTRVTSGETEREELKSESGMRH